MQMNRDMIFRRYQLEISAVDRARFVAEGNHNMTTSLATEPGTLTMIATHADDAGTHNVVFELYRDQASYQLHARSPQFKRYGQLAQAVVTGKAMDELQLEYLNSPQAGLNVSGASTQQILMFDLTVRPEWQAEFKARLTAKLDQDHGQVVAGYAATFRDQPARGLLLLTYQQSTDRVTDSKAWSAWLGQYAQPVTSQVLTVDTMVAQAGL
ncbi:hypothetical protein D1831_10920 [Lactiplantibacillus garii]|uniref:ABM domain-containing protein n=1 Tax=Lactiplantibacillus garii TaxID=2306423 RepID=A0A3R8J5Y0_9LACO|nr:antibiotic biosynthesis monooxygenase [Lactiplantibacillus garii]RRK09760.1 hypothetical protein D1831_10920 [Lactiplantibacillus garii]